MKILIGTIQDDEEVALWQIGRELLLGAEAIEEIARVRIVNRHVGLANTPTSTMLKWRQCPCAIVDKQHFRLPHELHIGEVDENNS